MVFIPGGTYAMPARRVLPTASANSFCLDATEVTADAYAACVRAGRCTSEGLQCHETATFGVPGKGQHPITCVNAYQATAYCTGLGMRLPTEDEWEWAARGGAQARTWAWGDAPPTREPCWQGVTNEWSTCPVGTAPGANNAFGSPLFDMTANASEWTCESLLSESEW